MDKFMISHFPRGQHRKRLGKWLFGLHTLPSKCNKNRSESFSIQTASCGKNKSASVLFVFFFVKSPSSGVGGCRRILWYPKWFWFHIDIGVIIVHPLGLVLKAPSQSPVERTTMKRSVSTKASEGHRIFGMAFLENYYNVRPYTMSRWTSKEIAALLCLRRQLTMKKSIAEPAERGNGWGMELRGSEGK